MTFKRWNFGEIVPIVACRAGNLAKLKDYCRLINNGVVSVSIYQSSEKSKTNVTSLFRKGNQTYFTERIVTAYPLKVALNSTFKNFCDAKYESNTHIAKPLNTCVSGMQIPMRASLTQ